jgi:hypothetical protein
LKKILALLIVVCPLYSALSQYTETINSNRPGASQGAFSVGRKVIQAESGFDFGNDTHSLRLFDSDIFGINLGLRYGLLWENLEINGSIRYQVNQVRFTSGQSPDDILQGLESTLLGVKYLIYDPYKYEKEEINLYSYRANHRFRWKSLIPVVSIYAAGVFDFTVNPFREFLAAGSGVEIEQGVSPNVAIITQNNWGRWVWVNNFIGDRITTEFPSYIWITTMTHSFSPKFSGFAEAQLINGDLNSDLIGRAGAAYLVSPNFQVDVSGLFNVKDTPSRWNVGLGVSYRLDFHDKDEQLEIREDEKGSSKKKSDRKKKKKNKRKDALDSGGDGGVEN